MPEIILISAFIISLVSIKLIKGNYQFALSGRIAMSAMLLLTAGAHFGFDEGMALMIPDFIPYRLELVYLTGLIEAAAAIGLLIPRYQRATGWFLVAFFIVLLPFNIYACLNQVNIQTATFDGDGVNYLWFRIPLQIFFIGWIYLSAIYKKQPQNSSAVERLSANGEL